MQGLLSKWGEEFAAAKVKLIQSGVWQVKLADQYFILKSRPNRSRAFEEYDLMNWLTKRNQPVSQLLLATNGMPWAEAQGTFYILYPYLVGKSGDAFNLTTEHFSNVGTSLASLHQELLAYDQSSSFPNFDILDEVSAVAWPQVRGYVGQRFRNEAKNLEKIITENLINPYQSLPRQLIHRDLHPGNLIFQGKEIKGILDFDRVRLGVRVFDLSYFASSVLSLTFSDLKEREAWPGKVTTFIKAYQETNPLTEGEVHSFLYIIYLIQCLFIYFHLDAGNQELADFNIAMLLWLLEKHDYFQPILQKIVLEVK